MSNTNQRILSALAMIIMVAGSVLLGKIPTLVLWMLVGVLCIDELLINFAKVMRKSSLYIIIIISFIFLFMTTNVFFEAKITRTFFIVMALCFNIFLLYYLFKIPIKDEFMKKNSLKNPGLLTAVSLFSLLSFGMHFETNDWRQIFIQLLIVTFGMDTGAWFFGKNFGKHKLWPEVSPNKTIEGLVGGMCTSAFLGSLCWYSFFGNYRWYYSVIFAICGILAQLGDLVQSKIKREFKIKDSSHLIPGHGGVYDRIDGLIFLSPFFVIVVKYLVI